MGSQETGAAGDYRARCRAHAFLRRSSGAIFQSGGHAVGMGGGASHAVISEALCRHHFGIIQVAAVDHDGILEFLAQAGADRGWRTLPTR